MEGAIELRGVAFKPWPPAGPLRARPQDPAGRDDRAGREHPGPGKTTLINLICRFFDVAEGAILVDGVDIRSFPVEAYRSNIGIVLQEPFLFFGTIAENIAYGRPDATPAEIINAARAASAHEFILRLPDAYDSVVGEPAAKEEPKAEAKAESKPEAEPKADQQQDAEKR